MEFINRYLLVLTVAVIILILPLKIILFGEETVSFGENRFKNMIPDFKVASYIKGDFQDDLEDALFDQLAYSQVFKDLYNDIRGIMWINNIEDEENK